MPQTQTFAGRFDQIRHICHFVVSGAEAAGFDPKTRFHIELACDEASTNIIEHAYGGEGNGAITVRWSIKDNVFQVDLRDTGKPFDPTAISAPAPITPQSTIDDIAVGGLGMHFMRTLMDEVHYAFDSAGNTVSLCKWIPPAAGAPVWWHRLSDGVLLVRARGRIDQDTITPLETQLKTLLADPQPAIVIDLAAVNYINSGGLRALVTAWRTAREKGGNIVLINLDERVREIISMVGFDKIIRIDDSLAAARRRLAAELNP